MPDSVPAVGDAISNKTGKASVLRNVKPLTLHVIGCF